MERLTSLGPLRFQATGTVAIGNMKLLVTFLVAFPLTGLATPLVEEREPDAGKTPSTNRLEARLKTCTMVSRSSQGCDSDPWHSQRLYTVQPNTRLKISCVTTGQSVNGDTVWDYAPIDDRHGCYISSAWMDNGCECKLPPIEVDGGLVGCNANSHIAGLPSC